MTTRTTLIEGKITGDGTQFIAEARKATDEAKKLARESDAAAQKTAAAQAKLGTEATKAGTAISGATSAIEAFGRGGTQSITGLTKSLAGVAGLLGPTGAIVGGAAVATIALVEMLAKPQRQAELLRKDLEETMRQLRSASDGQGLIRFATEITAGNPNAAPAADDASAIDKAKARLIRGGGLVAAKAELQRLENELRALEQQANRLAAASGTEERDLLTGPSPVLKRKTAELVTLRTAYGELEKAARDAAIQGTQLASREQQLANDLKKSRDAAVDRDKTTRDGIKATGQLETALTALQSRLEAVANAGDGPASLSLQLETLFAKVEQGGASAQQLARFRAEIDQLVSQASQQELEKLGDRLQDLVVQSTITATDDLALAASRLAVSYEEFAVAAEKANTDEGRAVAAGFRAQAEQAAAFNAQLIEVTKSLEDIAAQRQAASQLRGIGASALGGADLGGITSALVEAEALKEIERLLATPGLDPRNRVTLEAQRLAITEQIYNATKRTADLEGQTTTALSDNLTRTRQWVDALTGAAAAVGGLNTNLVRSLSGISQILGGVQGITEAARSAEGFGKLFSTGAGALAAASGVGAIVGGFAVIADSLDLFGTASRARAREMQAAAVQWGRALDDFLITTRSTLEESLRQNLRRAQELVTQAANATGVRSTLQVESAEDLRARVTQLQAVAAANRQASQMFAPFIAELEKLLVQVEANEATLRAQNEQRLLEATKDLEVRRLISEGRTTEADAMRRQLALQRELDAAMLDTSDSGKAYAAALQLIIAAELEAAAAAQARAAILGTLDSRLSIAGLTGQAALDAIITAIGEIAPQLAGLADGFDLSTREGLEGFRDKLRDYFEVLAADGIDDVEAPIVQLIQRILGGIEGALGALPEALDPIAAALEAFDVRAEVFGLTAAQRLQGILPLLGEQFADIGNALGGLDLRSTEGLGTLRERLESIIDTMTADGVIDAVEAPIIAAIRQILGVIGSVADEAAAAAAEATAIAESARQAAVASTRASLDGRIQLDDLSGANAVGARISAFAGLAPALAGLLDLDLTTLDGLTQAKALLRDVFRQIEDGTITAEQLGELLGPELASVILDLDGDFDTLIDGITSLADAARRTAEELQDFSGEVGRDFLAATGDRLGAELATIDDRIAKRIARARALGASEETIRQLELIGQAERNAAVARAADSAARDVEREASELAREADRAAASSSNRVTVRSVQSISEVTGQVLSGYLRTISTDVRGIHELLRGGMPVIRPPALPSSLGAVGGTVSSGGLSVGPISVTVTGPITGSSPSRIGDEIGRSVLQTISTGLGRLAGLQDGSSRR